jgi:hypothetical protein
MELKKICIYSIIIITTIVLFTKKVFAVENINNHPITYQSMHIHHYTDSNGIVYEYDTNLFTASIIDYLGTEKNITIPSSITLNTDNYTINIIEDWAFSNKELRSVKIPNSITNIGNWAFYKNHLTSVVIPNSVVTIGNGAFSQNVLTDFSIPKSITTIEANTFSENQLTNIDIPSSVTSIGVASFANNALNDVYIPNSVILIRERAFTDNQLTSIVIPNSVTAIEEEAFKNNQLLDILIPSTVNSIGNWCFMGNPLQNIYTNNGNTEDLKDILNTDVMLDIKADATSILEGPSAYVHDSNLDNILSIGESIYLEVKQQIKCVYDHSSSTWYDHIPNIQWYKDGEPLHNKTEKKLTITNINIEDAGLYYAILDDVILPEIQIEIFDGTSSSSNDSPNRSMQEEKQREGTDDINTGDQKKDILVYAFGSITTLGYMIFYVYKKVQN